MQRQRKGNFGPQSSSPALLPFGSCQGGSVVLVDFRHISYPANSKTCLGRGVAHLVCARVQNTQCSETLGIPTEPTATSQRPATQQNFQTTSKTRLREGHLVQKIPASHMRRLTTNPIFKWSSAPWGCLTPWSCQGDLELQWLLARTMSVFRCLGA